VDFILKDCSAGVLWEIWWMVSAWMLMDVAAPSNNLMELLYASLVTLHISTNILWMVNVDAKRENS